MDGGKNIRKVKTAPLAFKYQMFSYSKVISGNLVSPHLLVLKLLICLVYISPYTDISGATTTMKYECGGTAELSRRPS